MSGLGESVTGTRAEAAKDVSIAAVLGAFAAGLDYTAIPEPVRTRAKELILDAVGIALASTRYPFARKAVDGLRALDAGYSEVIGMGVTLSLRDAALVNGMLVHGLDFDDTYLPGLIHTTAACFPSALGMAAHRGSSGRDLLVAYIAGTEVATRISAVDRGALYRAGFHPTGIANAFGSTVAAGSLFGLGSQQLVMAQGLVLSMAAGTTAFLQDGAWTKRMHPGWAAACGITAAALAGAGVVGPALPYEGQAGLFPTHLGRAADTCNLGLATEALGIQWRVADLLVKNIPACHDSHGCAEAAMQLVRARPVSAGEIESITALIPEHAVKILCEPLDAKLQPQNSYAAQFSLPYIVACSLLRGRFTLRELEQDALNDPVTRALMQRVRYEVDPDAGYPEFYSGEVIVRTHAGETMRRRHVIRPEEPATTEQIVDKFMANASLVVDDVAQVRRVRDLILGLERVDDVRTITRTLGGLGGNVT